MCLQVNGQSEQTTTASPPASLLILAAYQSVDQYTAHRLCATWRLIKLLLLVQTSLFNVTVHSVTAAGFDGCCR